MAPIFQRAYPPAAPSSAAALWLPFHQHDLLVHEVNGTIALASGSADLLDGLMPGPSIYLGTLDGVPCLACAVQPEGGLADGWQPRNLRALYGQIDETTYRIVGYAAHMLLWQRASRFCPACGHPTEPVSGDWGRRCTNCGLTRYPQISPAILALVHDGDRVLLTHKPGWGKRYSIIAGFVEPGESLEGCVRREVAEETGVTLNAVAYVGSQPWPFPDQLMIGYMAEYAGGDIAIDDHELDDAKWFHVDALPELPPPLSLSRQIIDRWVQSRRG